jgi:hypothetical protein
MLFGQFLVPVDTLIGTDPRTPSAPAVMRTQHNTGHTTHPIAFVTPFFPCTAGSRPHMN